MTEEEWESNDSLTGALYALDLGTSSRKMRLIVVACLRASRALFPDDAAAKMIRCLEQHADDTTLTEPASSAVKELDVWNQGTAPHEPVLRSAIACADTWQAGFGKYTFALMSLLDARVRSRGFFLEERVEYEARCAESVEVLGLLRDIIGNPFQPVVFDPVWRTEYTVGMAAKMYEGRGFAAMPILADALEEAGCENADILAHCREPGVHVRGCWVVDLVLEKA